MQSPFLAGATVAGSQQVVRSVLANAIKFSPLHGVIELTGETRKGVFMPRTGPAAARCSTFTCRRAVRPKAHRFPRDAAPLYFLPALICSGLRALYKFS